jgi:hypothetical protein
MYAVEFTCRFTAPFHTSAQNFSNVFTCAPFVPGSTLRGAVLRWLIDHHCTRVDELHQDNPGYHERCPADCPIREFFTDQVRFSFGHFEAGSTVGVQTKLGLSRVTGSAAAGALLSVEVRRGRFRFRAAVPRAELLPLLCAAVDGAGALGLGRFKSIGWGQFVKEKGASYVPPALPSVGCQMTWEFRTPYVVRHPERGEVLSREDLQADLDAALDPDHVEVQEVRARVKGLSYLRRWSYETEGRENRLVVDPGTTLEITLDRPLSEEQMRKLLWGLGEWRRWGYGEIRINPV